MTNKTMTIKFSDFKAKTAHWNHFARVDTLGSFDFCTSIVSLESLKRIDLEEIQKFCSTPYVGGQKITSKQYSILSKVLPLVHHEYTHFIDATSTVWGFKHLELMNQAYISNPKFETSENEYFHAKNFFDHIRTLKFPAYYTFIYEHSENQLPWSFNISIGKIFSAKGIPSKRPVIFSRFKNKDNQHLVRSPISSISVLESSAMSQELQIKAMLISLLNDDNKHVEEKIFEKEILNYIYNPQITEYSVCAHILANFQKCEDIISTFILCGIIARIVLNCTDEIYKKIKNKCDLHTLIGVKKKQKGVDETFIQRIYEGLDCYDMGILFYLFCCALPLNSYEFYRKEKYQFIEETLNKLEITLNDIKTSSQQKIQEISTNIIVNNKNQIQPILSLAQAGYQNYKQISILNHSLTMDDLALPPALLGDSTSHFFFKKHKIFQDFDLDDCFDKLYQGQSWVEKFAEACM